MRCTHLRATMIVATLLICFAHVVLPAAAGQRDRELIIKFRESMINIPAGQESGGKEVIVEPDDPAAALLLASDLVSISYAHPSHLRRDSTVTNRFGIKVKRPNFDGVYVLEFATEESRVSAQQSLDQEPNVDYVREPGIARSDQVLPNDPYFVAGSQTNLHDPVGDHDIDAPEAWEIETGESTTKLGIVEVYPMRLSHEDLAPRAIGDGGSDNHGTHVAGIAAATGNNGRGIAGVHWGATILSKSPNDEDAEPMADKVIEAVDAGAHVINCSWGLVGGADNEDVESAVNYAYAMGALVVASKGNDATSSPHYPSDYDVVLAVSNVNDRDQFYSQSSNWGNGVWVAAPGVSIYSCGAWADDDYYPNTGTSMAAPHVSGTAALLHSYNSQLVV